jgi:uncharacterized delta-60 repeat protein
LNAEGTPDPSFGAAGLTVLNSTTNRGLASGPATEPLLVWGGLRGEFPVTQVTRLHADGTVDAGYGTNGTRNIPGGGGAAVLGPNGDLFVLERPEQKPAHVLRLKPDGSLSPGFGKDGVATVRLRGSNTALSSLAVDSHGRVLLVGTAMRPGRVTASRGQPRELLVVGRLLASGRMDRSFGRDGWQKTGFGSHTKVAGARELFEAASGNIGGPRATLDPQGRLLVADAAHSPQLQPGGVVLARYLSGG